MSKDSLEHQMFDSEQHRFKQRAKTFCVPRLPLDSFDALLSHHSSLITLLSLMND
jgi:hypothetical protein